MSKTRKYIILFLVLSLSFFFLLSGVFGTNGYLYNKALLSQLKVIEYEEDTMNMELETLEMQRESLSTEEGLRDAAISLGYYVEGDEVYRFSTPALQESVAISVNKPQAIEFIPLKPVICILIATGISAIVVLIVAVMDSKRQTNNDIEQDKSGDTSDTYYIDG